MARSQPEGLVGFLEFVDQIRRNIRDVGGPFDLEVSIVPKRYEGDRSEHSVSFRYEGRYFFAEDLGVFSREEIEDGRSLGAAVNVLQARLPEFVVWNYDPLANRKTSLSVERSLPLFLMDLVALIPETIETQGEVGLTVTLPGIGGMSEDGFRAVPLYTTRGEKRFVGPVLEVASGKYGWTQLIQAVSELGEELPLGYSFELIDRNNTSAVGRVVKVEAERNSGPKQMFLGFPEPEDEE